MSLLYPRKQNVVFSDALKHKKRYGWTAFIRISSYQLAIVERKMISSTSNTLLFIQNGAFITQNNPFFTKNALFLIQNDVFLIQNDVFLTHNSAFLTQNDIFFTNNTLFLTHNRAFLTKKTEQDKTKNTL